MGCVMSSIEEDGKMGICKERKRLIKQLVGIRGEFSDSLLVYLRALRNTGATLRQFTESDSLEIETPSNDLAGPPSPQPQLPPYSPPPPPPPPFIADKQVSQEEIVEHDYKDVHGMEIHPSMSSLWPFSPTRQNYEVVESIEEESWEETKTEFEDGEMEAAVARVVKSRSGKQQAKELVDDNSSAMSLYRKDTKAMPIVVRKNAKTLEGIVEELDDYFLKASACVKEIAVLIDISVGDTLLWQNSGHHNRKGGNSAKVFSVLSWSRSKSPQFTRDAAECSAPGEPCRPGAHCATLKKLYEAEKKLFKAVKEEEIAKLEFERKSLLLQKQEDENIDWVKIEKTRSSVENLESVLVSQGQFISETTSSILELIDEELTPQLVALTAGLTQMWSTMHECHQAQELISHKLSNLSDNQNTLLNSEYHHQATVQFEAEASYWYNSFCKLVKTQKEYVKTLCKWIQLTKHLRDGDEGSDNSSRIRTICAQWKDGLEQLPDKDAADAIKDLLSAIRSIIAQQTEEDNILKKLEKLERRLERCMNSLTEMTKKFDGSFENDGDIAVNMSPRHPLSVKKTKAETLKKQVESVKADYLDSIQCSRVMTLNHLKTTLPRVFQSLMAFSSASAEAIDGRNPEKPEECSDISSQN
ncbi:hypothetical protein Lal_00003511 [Lupinus albus]|uniref:Uncharacterized protein n=1 Tax=Lupinus albus TaxID=3870 RepID=A0A6A5MHY3_LUPAL|nr:hypothetical protein Lalb_Chr08g0233211 [Lupinus albus]KAF1870305.1 hypothetical protein Lal_00003511 [Lupinus albus]